MPDPIDTTRSIRTKYEEDASSDELPRAPSAKEPAKTALDVDWNGDGGMSSNTAASSIGDAPSSSLAPTKQQLAAAWTAKYDRPIESDPLGNALVSAAAGGGRASIRKLAATSMASLAITAGCDKAALSLVKATAKAVGLQAVKSALSGPPIPGNSERGIVPPAAARFVPSKPETANGGMSSRNAASQQPTETNQSITPWSPSPLLIIKG